MLKYLDTYLFSDKYKIIILTLLIFLSIFSIYFLKPKIAGDSLLYTESIEVIKTGIIKEDFVPMMIVSTYLGLRLIMFFDFFLNNIEISWLLLDSLLYIIMGVFFYSFIKSFFKDRKIAFLSTMFFVTNYSAITFGLGYLMDIGGWLAYVASLYFSYKYFQTNENKWVLISSVIIGVGGLYKEYSFVATFVIAGVIISNNWQKWSNIAKYGVLTFILAFMPFFILNIYGHFVYNYTYIEWFMYNQGAYDYQNRLVEFIKSFGSIYNFGWFLFFPGFFILLKNTKEIFDKKELDKNTLFIWFTILSCFSVLLWPVVTRVLFVTMPAVILVSSLFFEKFKNKLYLFLPLFLLYLLSAYFMDSFILDFVNLPI